MKTKLFEGFLCTLRDILILNTHKIFFEHPLRPHKIYILHEFKYILLHIYKYYTAEAATLRIFEQPSETFMYIIQFQMWLGGDGIPMLCDVWRGFNVCALNFNEFLFCFVWARK